MKKIIITVLGIALAFPVVAQKSVSGYVRKDGTFVQGYTRAAPDSYRYNNRGAETVGGSQRDEYSSGTGATNRTNPSYRWRDNDSDGISNPYDRAPDVRRRW